jgi:hypothetical protein
MSSKERNGLCGTDLLNGDAVAIGAIGASSLPGYPACTAEFHKWTAGDFRGDTQIKSQQAPDLNTMRKLHTKALRRNVHCFTAELFFGRAVFFYPKAERYPHRISRWGSSLYIHRFSLGRFMKLRIAECNSGISMAAWGAKLPPNNEI